MPQNLYSERQIAMIRQSGKIVAECLAAVKALAVPGSSTGDMNRAVGEVIAKYGARSPFLGYTFPGKKPFPAFVCDSYRAQRPERRKSTHGVQVLNPWLQKACHLIPD